MVGINFTGSEAYIQDRSGSPLYSFGGGTTGSRLYLGATEVQMQFSNLINTRPKTNIDHGLDLNNSETGIGSDKNFDRRKPFITYQGFESPIINVTGIIHLDEARVGSKMAGTVLATPGVLRTLWMNSDRTFWFFDPKLTNSFITDPHAETPNPYTGSSAIPVVIQDLQFNASSESNMLPFRLTLTEDKTGST